MSTPERGPASRLLAASFMVFLAALLLWLAVWLIQQIWIWLLVIGLAAAAAAVFALVLRLRRDGWFR